MQAGATASTAWSGEHAITVWRILPELRKQIRGDRRAMYAGIDPVKNIVFNQSQVPEHAELAQGVRNCVARMGHRPHDAVQGRPARTARTSPVGLFAYPGLMAADVLVYRATHVPVGEGPSISSWPTSPSSSSNMTSPPRSPPTAADAEEGYFRCPNR